MQRKQSSTRVSQCYWHYMGRAVLDGAVLHGEGGKSPQSQVLHANSSRPLRFTLPHCLSHALRKLLRENDTCVVNYPPGIINQSPTRNFEDCNLSIYSSSSSSTETAQTKTPGTWSCLHSFSNSTQQWPSNSC